MYDGCADVNTKLFSASLDFWPENGESALQQSAESLQTWHSADYVTLHSALRLDLPFPFDIKMKYASNESQILCEFQIYYTNQALVLQPCALFQGICPFTHFHPAVSGGVNVNAKVNKLTNF